MRPVAEIARPGPSPRLNADRSSGRWRHTTSRRSTSPRPHSVAARVATASVTWRSEASTPSSASEVTRLSGMPHGTMCEKYAMSGATLRAKPCIDRPRVSRTPIAAILRGSSPSGSTHTPG